MVNPHEIANLITEDPDLPSQRRTDDLSTDIKSTLQEMSLQSLAHDIAFGDLKEPVTSRQVTLVELTRDLFNKAFRRTGSVLNAVEVLEFPDDHDFGDSSIEYIGGHLVAYDGFRGENYDVVIESEQMLGDQFITVASKILDGMVHFLLSNTN